MTMRDSMLLPTVAFRAAGLLAVLLVFASCSGGEAIQGVGGGTIGGRKQDVSHRDENDGNGSDDDPEEAPPSGSNISSTGEEPAIVYPRFTYQSVSGNVHCDDHDLDSALKLATNVDATTTTTALTSLTINCDIGAGSDTCRERTTESVRRALGTTIYDKTTDEELNQYKDSLGLKVVSFASYSATIFSSQKGRASVSPPIPTVVLPVASSRFDAIRGKPPMVWNATMAPGDGSSPFAIQVMIRHAGDQGDVTQVEVTTTIPSDQDGTLYAKSSIPYKMTYYVDTATRDLRQIAVESRFPGDCDGFGTATYRLQLCSKTTGDKVEGTPCP